MKKIFYSAFAILLAFSLKSSSQTIPNAGFENWSSIHFYDNPANYQTSNLFSYLSNSQSVTIKSTDKHGGSYAVKLQCIVTPNDTMSGAIFMGSPGSQTILGGYPYTQKPDSLIGYVKYNIASGDTARIFLVFKKSGIPMAFVPWIFTGNQSSYTRFSLPIDFQGNPSSPDTMGVVITNTSFDAPHPSSVLYVDDLSFKGTNITQPFPNGDFEDWTEVGGEEPDGWLTSNLFTIPGSGNVLKTSDKYSENFAAQITTSAPAFPGGDTLSFLILGQLGSDGPTGGIPVTTIPVALTGYYKYAPVGNDTGVALISFHKWNSTTMKEDSLGDFIYKFTATNTYTPFSIPIYTLLGTPDSVLIGFASSDPDDGGAHFIGSQLKVDEISFQFPNGVTIPLNEYCKVNMLYPNPATESVTLGYTLDKSTDVTVNIYDVSGRVIKTVELGNEEKGAHQFALNVKEIVAGTYFYSFNAGEKEVVKKFTIVR